MEVTEIFDAKLLKEATSGKKAIRQDKKQKQC